MEKSILYMLTPWVEDNNQGPFYCPDCAIVEGYFFYAPEAKDQIEIRAVNFAKPRKELVAVLGEENQSSPVLVLRDEAKPPEYAKKSLTTGKSFIDDPKMICEYLSKVYNTAKPHK